MEIKSNNYLLIASIFFALGIYIGYYIKFILYINFIFIVFGIFILNVIKKKKICNLFIYIFILICGISRTTIFINQKNPILLSDEKIYCHLEGKIKYIFTSYEINKKKIMAG